MKKKNKFFLVIIMLVIVVKILFSYSIKGIDKYRAKNTLMGQEIYLIDNYNLIKYKNERKIKTLSKKVNLGIRNRNYRNFLDDLYGLDSELIKVESLRLHDTRKMEDESLTLVERRLEVEFKVESSHSLNLVNKTLKKYSNLEIINLEYIKSLDGNMLRLDCLIKEFERLSKYE